MKTRNTASIPVLKSGAFVLRSCILECWSSSNQIRNKSVVPAVTVWVGYQSYIERKVSDATSAPLLVRAPQEMPVALPTMKTSGEIVLHEFSPELRQVFIYDIVADGDRLWIGTGKGLLTLRLFDTRTG